MYRRVVSPRQGGEEERQKTGEGGNVRVGKNGPNAETEQKDIAKEGNPSRDTV